MESNHVAAIIVTSLIDTVAVEVERGTEAQRFTAKLLAERLELPSGAGAGSVARVVGRGSER